MASKEDIGKSSRIFAQRDFEFEDGGGNIVRKTKEGLSLLGRAYGFLYCNASKEEIEKYLPQAREDASTPNSLELCLEEGINPENPYIRHDLELRELAYQANSQGNNYTMIASLPDSSNERTAHELGDIQNALYQSPLKEKFHKDDGKFWGGIVYKEGKEYQFLE